MGEKEYHRRNKAAVEAQKALQAEDSRLALLRKKQEEYDYRLARPREIERKREFAYQQDEQRCRDR